MWYQEKVTEGCGLQSCLSQPAAPRQEVTVATQHPLIPVCGQHRALCVVDSRAANTWEGDGCMESL